ncbi:SCO family protein [Pedobacter sp. SYSU D00535]|uniref:SCO family protein n=1 Tax=Pedobacter sp. SYSU D00535 TaxID=2810308 RepID=UPI001A97968E|nr:SCO family protein [Pedobacter sp. SYSU D00535]
MSNKSSSLKKVLILVSILAVPGFLYYLLQEKGKNRYRPLSIYGPKEVASTFHTKRGKKIPDTIYHQIGNFKLVGRTGDSVAFPADTGKIAVVHFFDTKCKTCPGIPVMQRVAEVYNDNQMVLFYSIAVDKTGNDSAVLAKLSDSLNTHGANWRFLGGNSGEISDLARKEFLVDVFERKTGDTVTSPIIVLVDPRKRIRGFYDASSREQVDKLLDEIKVQIAEELRQVAHY